ncbi:hypothetical protein OHA74_55320 [Streptomyces phaeochromogenes]|uniref:hypothetical protein n=1 Tax=Streptomyces phaeochromogenes TaxID=1923 RepID=UPI002E280588|nr:hypothetical protein [Streptomyces phaeochromogenes]
MKHPPKAHEPADTVFAWFGLALSVMLLIVGINMNRDGGEWSMLVIGSIMVVASLHQLRRDRVARRDHRGGDES